MTSNLILQVTLTQLFVARHPFPVQWFPVWLAAAVHRQGDAGEWVGGASSGGTRLHPFLFPTLQGRLLEGGFWFAVLLNLKHIFLYVAPAYFVYLLRHFCFHGNSPSSASRFLPLRFLMLGGMVVGVFLLSFGPFMWLVSYSSHLSCAWGSLVPVLDLSCAWGSLVPVLDLQWNLRIRTLRREARTLYKGHYSRPQMFIFLYTLLPSEERPPS